VETLVAAYRADLLAAGMFAENPVTSPARSFLSRVGVQGWSMLSLTEQCATPLKDRWVVGWLMVTGRCRPSPDYLVLGRPYLGEVAARHHRGFHAQFAATAAELGFDQRSTLLQWSAIVKVATLLGLAPDRLTKADLDAGREQLSAAIRQHRPDAHGVRRALTTALFGAEATLFHAGVIDVPPRKTHPDKSAARATEWAAVAPRLAATLLGYVEQMRLSLRAATMVSIEGALREFAGWLTREAPEVNAVCDLRGPTSRTTSCTWPGGPPPAAGGCPRPRWPNTSAPCAPALSGSLNGPATTFPPGCWSSLATCPAVTSHCPDFSTTGRQPSCCKPPALTPTRSPGSPWSSWPAPGCARASSAI
jgi:hypothetical protein